MRRRNDCSDSPTVCSPNWNCPNQGQNGNNMETPIALEQPNGLARATRTQTRQSPPLPPAEARDWLSPNETALEIGCSVATVHRLRHGLIPGIEPLPFCQYVRKIALRKAAIAPRRGRHE